jgi:hypothetical protein
MKTSEWTAALRSGGYGQAQERLADGYGNYCCLGVLCEVAGLPKETPDDDEVQYVFELPEAERSPYHQTSTRADSTLPSFAQRGMLEDLDLTVKLGEMVYVDDQGYEHAYQKQSLHDRLMSLNDDGASFAYIATYIEKVVADGSR